MVCIHWDLCPIFPLAFLEIFLHLLVESSASNLVEVVPKHLQFEGVSFCYPGCVWAEEHAESLQVALKAPGFHFLELSEFPTLRESLMVTQMCGEFIILALLLISHFHDLLVVYHLPQTKIMTLWFLLPQFRKWVVYLGSASLLYSRKCSLAENQNVYGAPFSVFCIC